MVSRVNRIYYPQALECGCEFVITGDTHHYISRVLRTRSGDSVRFFNHLGQEFECEFVSATRKESTYRCRQQITPLSEPAIATQLDIAICKADRMSIAFQKATELGVQIFQPIISANNKHHRFRMEHLQGVVRSASEQCGRAWIPSIQPLMAVQDILPISEGEKGWVLDPTARGQDLAIDPDPSLQKVRIAVGPEGGWQDEEVQHLRRQGFCPAYLGERVMRNETAVIAALSIVQHQLGQLR